MGMLAVILIFICICVDNMVCANMSAMKLEAGNKDIFSIKMALFFAGFNALFFGLGYLISIIFFRDWVYFAHNWVAFSFLLLLGICLIHFFRRSSIKLLLLKLKMELTIRSG